MKEHENQLCEHIIVCTFCLWSLVLFAKMEIVRSNLSKKSFQRVTIQRLTNYNYMNFLLQSLGWRQRCLHHAWTADCQLKGD